MMPLCGYPQLLWITLLIHSVKNPQSNQFCPPQQIVRFLISAFWAIFQQLKGRNLTVLCQNEEMGPGGGAHTYCEQIKCGNKKRRTILRRSQDNQI
jgi:hypothetical protein